MFLPQQNFFFVLPNAVVPNASRIIAGSKVEVSKKTSP
jgi:hypothetical protein